MLSLSPDERRALVEAPDVAIDGTRVGIDVVDVQEVLDALGRHGDRYVQHLFTGSEVADSYAADPHGHAQRLAARFAAKEAAFKVLQVGEHHPAWTDVEVVRQPNGACSLELRGEAAELAGAAGITSIALSMSHEGNVAMAVAFALCSSTV